MKTPHEIKMTFGKGPKGTQAEITIPAGTRVTACGDGTGQYFVEDLSWLDRNSMTWHDANYYGIRLDANQVEAEMYVCRNGDFYELRQARYRGKNHPHDVCAISRTVDEMHDMADKHWPAVDYSAVENTNKESAQ